MFLFFYLKLHVNQINIFNNNNLPRVFTLSQADHRSVSALMCFMSHMKIFFRLNQFQCEILFAQKNFRFVWYANWKLFKLALIKARYLQCSGGMAQWMSIFVNFHDSVDWLDERREEKERP